MEILKKITCINNKIFEFEDIHGLKYKATLYNSKVIRNNYMQLENEIARMIIFDFEVEPKPNHDYITNHFYYCPFMDKDKLLEKALEAKNLTIDNLITSAQEISENRSNIVQTVRRLSEFTGCSYGDAFITLKKFNYNYDRAVKILMQKSKLRRK